MRVVVQMRLEPAGVDEVRHAAKRLGKGRSGLARREARQREGYRWRD